MHNDPYFPPGEPRRLIVGISGATGIAYGIRLLEALRDTDVESHLVVTRPGLMTLDYETDITRDELYALADTVYPASDVGAAISSGSMITLGMIVAPCAVKSAAEIASGATQTLLTRAADVTLKERRRLVLMVRESPLHTGHLRTLTEASEIGAVIMPPMPAFYPRPETIEDMVDHTVGRALDLFGIEHDLLKRWTGTPD
ncbi:MAG: UbiX family flavin prenyltransferase [Rhodospirillaceae bacterium]|jgi:4-hydroxy-3-polyprenylbenzoate decarboxylase|nr:UbiX family flavin prenyltransferase [Rhodospirillaceae bacterium]MBT5943507.1 UbiX family flavin prenyltransferase [Rhodospirillaceae bacterium]MBT6404935.1 UbiX family flavin prenyltransferase [Rhodospirillaceae bacterium]MBT6537509.1 UbiX family flavin prenyltransferase [Rhodospirillaceae bacterium]MBT7361338.1 UbiX family flavin prenyltransferase [Rhodospirillaceae bacterium]